MRERTGKLGCILIGCIAAGALACGSSSALPGAPTAPAAGAGGGGRGGGAGAGGTGGAPVPDAPPVTGSAGAPATIPAPADAPAAADAASADVAPATPTTSMAMVYVGGFRAEVDVFRLDMASATYTKVGAVASPPAMPSFFAWHPSGKWGYSVDEVDDGKVVAYAIDQTTGLLSRLNDAPVMGVGPTYIALDRTAHWALTACWAGNNTASIAVNAVGDDGKVGAVADRRTFELNGYAHFITTDPTNHFVFASINGEGSVAQYRFDAATGKLTENNPARVMRPGGPRHMDFHPNGKFAYLINEQGNTVTVYAFDSITGLLRQIQDIATLPSGFSGGNSTAHILVHRSGRFVYGSNRGHDSIVIYSVDAATGLLQLVGFQTGVGATPRNFAIDPTGTLLLVAGQGNGLLTTYKIDQNTGMLSRVGTPLAVGSKPTYVTVQNIPAR